MRVCYWVVNRTLRLALAVRNTTKRLGNHGATVRRYVADMTPTAVLDTCDLCGTDVSGPRARAQHLRSAHPAYARNVLMRIAAPLVLATSLFVLAALRAPTVTLLLPVIVSCALVFVARIGSARARVAAGAPAPGVRKLVRDGGLRFLLVFPALGVLVLVALSRIG
jgi:hypothetical protein